MPGVNNVIENFKNNYEILVILISQPDLSSLILIKTNYSRGLLKYFLQLKNLL